MPLPAGLTTITVTGHFPGGDGVPRTGNVVFTPTSDLTYPSGDAIIPAAPIIAPLYAGMFSIVLLCTDNAGVSPTPWYWSVTRNIDGEASITQTYAIPSTLGASVDLADLVEVTPGPAMVGYIVTASQMSVTGTPSAGQVLTATGATSADWQNSAGGGGGGISPPAGDIGGTAGSPTVVSTHLAAPLPLAQGGTAASTAASARTALGLGTAATADSTAFDAAGAASTAQTNAISAAESNAASLYVPLSSLPLAIASGGTGHTTQASALTALAGAQTAGRYLRSDGTNTALAAIQAGDVPTLNQSTTGTAAGLSATLAIGSGGTGQTTAQAAINALTGAQSAGKFLRSDGTNATLAAIQAGDVPTLNQSTTGTAAGLSATLGIGSGGTGQTSQQAAINALTGTQSAGKYLRSDGTNAALATIQAGDVPTLNQSTTGTAAGLSTTLAIGSGGTGATTAIAARANLGEYVWDSPASRALLEYNFPPQLATVSNNLVSGSIYGVSFIAQGNSAVTKVGVGVLSSAATPTSGQNLIGLYSISGTTATQIAVTGDLGTWGSQGFNSFAFGAGQTLTAGATYLLLVMSNATTPVHLAGLSTTAGFPPMYNAGLSNTAAPWFKVFLYGTAQTALPSSFTISGTTMASTSSQFPWVCLL